MHVCGSCGATSGDNFLYGGLGGTTCTPVLSEPVWHMVVCETGHWTKLGESSWPPGFAPTRPASAVGLVGEPAAIFRLATCGPNVRVTQITEANLGAMARRMVGTYRWR